jgi:hypothetical protein
VIRVVALAVVAVITPVSAMIPSSIAASSTLRCCLGGTEGPVQ